MSTQRSERGTSPQYNWQETYHLGERALAQPAHVIYQILSSRPITNVLELGCGTGRFALAAPTDRAWRITGIDINADAIAQFQQHIITDSLPDRAITGDITQQDFNGENFDAAVSWRVLHTLPKQKQIELCVAIFDALPPGASFFIAVASHTDWKAQELAAAGIYNPYDINNCAHIMELDQREGQETFHVDFFWREKLEHLASVSGFELVGDVVEFEEPSGYEHLRKNKPPNRYLIAEFRKPLTMETSREEPEIARRKVD